MGQRISWAMAGGRGALQRLTVAAAAVGRAQLAAAGCRPVQPAPRPDTPVPAAGRPELWLAGRLRAEALVDTAGDPELLAGAPHLDPALVAAVSELASPAELLLCLGGDDRQVPVAGRNSYGLPLYDLTPRVRLSSCTATPPDGAALSCADGWRRRTLAAALASQHAPDPARLHREVSERLLTHLGLPADRTHRVVLAPSGTDVETLVTAIVAGSVDQPVLNITVGVREAGQGSRLAAAGRAFLTRAAFRLDNEPGATVRGLDGQQIRTVDVDIRDATGRARRAFDVEAEIEAHLEQALGERSRVLVHVMDGSKTGLRQPTVDWVRRWRREHPTQLRVLVDGAQGRVPASRVRAYLAAGASVCITGSKALGGPPFCGALLLDAGLADDCLSLRGLPEGLTGSLSRAELPPALSRIGGALQPANYGLLARWHTALGEWERLRLVPVLLRETVSDALLAGLRHGLAGIPGVELLAEPEAHRSIVSMRVRCGPGRHCSREELRPVYLALVRQPGVQAGQPVELVANRAGVLRYAVGATTITRLLDSDQPVANARAMAADAVGCLADAVPAAVPG